MDKPQLPKMLKKLYLFLSLLCSLAGFKGYTQTFPISVNTQITQPSPIYLSKYADATTINSPIKIQLVLNDLTISNRQVRLKIYFQGNGVSFSNNDFVVGAKPLYLEGGFPLQLTNVDLAPYFQYQNLLGLNPNQYAQPLPEGISNFYVEVYDFATGKKLSRKTGTTTVIFQNEPPFLNLPLNNASIMQQNIQNIVFSWTPRSINVSNVEYEFSLVEIWDNYTPVQNAFAYSPPLYTTTTKMTTLQYGMSEPQLIPGKKYAWRIKAKAILGAEEIGVFKNNGYTEIFAFTYEVFCTSPLAVKTESIGQDQAKISWSGNIDNFDYRVNYREKNSGSQWYKAVTPRENITLSNLKPNTTYEYTVGASCDVGKYINSSIFEFTTIARDEIVFQGCGIKPDPRDLANQTPLPELFPNDVITAGDFPVVVLKAIGSNGNFSGEGYVTLPFLEKFRKLIDAADALGAKDENGASKGNLSENTRIRITFNNVGVNSDFKLISGEIIAAYDPTWSGISDLDGVINDAFGDAGNVVNQDIQFPIKSVVKNPDGSITITGPDDVKVNLPKTVNDIIITDKNGKQYAVPANAPAGNIEKTGQLAPGGIPNSKNTNGMGSGGSVTEISSPDINVIFSKGNGFYAFDTAPAAANGSLGKTYETIPQKSGGTYNVNLKAISNSPNKTDIVIATANFKNGKTKKDIVFKTQNGTAIDSTQIVWNDNVATLTLKKTLDFAKETVIATVKPATSKDPKETVGKYDIAGTIDLWHLTNKKVNVTLVSVNNASIPANAKEQLNAIYEPAGVTFDVNTINVTLNNSWGESIETSDSDLLNTYTPDQQQITNNLKAKLGSDYKKDTYYVIYTGAPSDKSNLLGFMPLKRQYGFIFNKTNTVRTLAHELGHGVFGLKHPFTEYNTATTTDLLMDYGTGVLLSHNDWQVLHAPGLQLYPFIQGDSDGEFAGGYVISPDYQIFSIGLDKTKVDKNTYNNNDIMANDGTLPGFVFNENQYWWKEGKYINATNNYTLTDLSSNINALKYKWLFLFFDKEKDCGKRTYLSVKIADYIASKKSLKDFISQYKDSKTKEFIVCNDPNVKNWNEINTSGGNINNAFIDYSDGKDGKSPFSNEQKSEMSTTITSIDSGLETNLKVYLLNTGHPKYNLQKAEAENDKSANKLIFTYSEQSKKIDLQHKFSVPKWLTDALPATYSNSSCTFEYINEGLTELHKNPAYKASLSFDQALQEARIITYRAAFGMIYCATNEEAVQSSNAATKYVAGVLHEVIATVDLVELVKGLTKMGTSAVDANVNSYKEFYQDIQKTCDELKSGQSIEPAVLAKKLLPPGIRNDIKLYNTVVETAKQFSSFYFSDCDKYKFKNGQIGDICAYRYGQITIMIVPIVLTAGEYLFAKVGGLVGRLKTISTLGRTEEVANLLIEAEKTGKTIVSETERIVIKESDDVVTAIEKKADEIIIKKTVKITTTDELKSFLTTIDETTTIAQLEEKGIKSLFRGTTRSKADNSLFTGNTNSQAYGISTSTDPIKATIFAIESATEYGSTKGVLQIGLPSDLKSLKLNSPNIYRCEKELEIVIQTPADNFANLAEVEISVEHARELVKEVYNIDLDTKIYRDVSNELLETLPPSSLEKSFEFYQKAQKYNLK